jgi:enoyl-CoA hydratase
MSMSETTNTLRMERPFEGVAVLTINRPQARNALNVETVAALGGALSRLNEDSSVRVVVLAGEGGHLSAGSDIKEMLKLGLACLRDPIRMRGWAQIEAFRSPLFAAVDGLALGAGLELALIADFIVAGPSARFGFPELRLGVLPGDGGSQRLPRRIGQAAALRMMLTGDIIEVQEAVRLGLAEFAPDGALAMALAMSKRIAANAPLAARMVKQIVKLGGDGPLATGLSLEGKALELLFASKDREEGMTAFVEKRAPLFKGV